MNFQNHLLYANNINEYISDKNNQKHIFHDPLCIIISSTNIKSLPNQTITMTITINNNTPKRPTYYTAH